MNRKNQKGGLYCTSGKEQQKNEQVKKNLWRKKNGGLPKKNMYI